MADRYYLARFKNAQDFGVYEKALQEIKNGRKMSHWMWFIFPQLKWLGRSSTSMFYGINGLDEAREYLAHPILGERLREISQMLLQLDTNDAHAVFGSPDDMKLRSCMTLFDKISPNDIFADVLDKYFDGQRDCRTLSIVRQKI